MNVDHALPVRDDDPDTSAAAALKAVLGASKVRPIVLALIRQYGPCTHDELIEHYTELVRQNPNIPRASHSGIRTRLRELVQGGLVTQDDTPGVSNFGNTAKRWIATAYFADVDDTHPDPSDQQTPTTRDGREPLFVPISDGF